MNDEKTTLISDLDRFDFAWWEVEKAGDCDGFGGGEYRRIRGEWIRADRTLDDVGLAAFIRTRANLAHG